ncbi:MAG: hypothetical protein ACKVK8_04790, partial [Rhodospirillales bacterium]
PLAGRPSPPALEEASICPDYIGWTSSGIAMQSSLVLFIKRPTENGKGAIYGSAQNIITFHVFDGLHAK